MKRHPTEGQRWAKNMPATPSHASYHPRPLHSHSPTRMRSRPNARGPHKGRTWSPRPGDASGGSTGPEQKLPGRQQTSATTGSYSQACKSACPHKAYYHRVGTNFFLSFFLCGGGSPYLLKKTTFGMSCQLTGVMRSGAWLPLPWITRLRVSENIKRSSPE